MRPLRKSTLCARFAPNPLVVLQYKTLNGLHILQWFIRSVGSVRLGQESSRISYREGTYNTLLGVHAVCLSIRGFIRE